MAKDSNPSFFSLSGYPELDFWARNVKKLKNDAYGYPGNQYILLKDFYKWYIANGLESVCLNNVGDPFCETPSALSSQKFEREVIEYFGRLHGFSQDNIWGLVTNSGTDSNNHGIYFGVRYLSCKTGRQPLVYVSEEAHYSNLRLADLQKAEVRLVKSDAMGRMIPQEFEKVLDPSRPCLMIFAMGSTFKGAIDDQRALNAVLAKYPGLAVYRHVDAALFGGYLPFTSHRAMVDRNCLSFDSIAVSGHKFFGMDEPAGLFITTRDVYEHQTSYEIKYLNENMRMINCSRSSLNSLKFWWLIHKVGYEQWCGQAETMLANAAYLKGRLDEISYPCWLNELSNTVFFRRPNEWLVKKYSLANNFDVRLGGDLSHIVVMQHVTKEGIDRFVEDLKKQIRQ